MFEPSQRVDVEKKFDLIMIQPCNSRQTPLIQLADLLTGLGVYSRTEYSGFEKWMEVHEPQMNLFSQDVSTNFSKTQGERYRLLKEFEELCQSYHFNVYLRKDRGLRTKNPRSNLNFWWYIPQHQNDRAPTKSIKMATSSTI